MVKRLFGRLLRTLSHRLDAEEREWKSLNRVREELAPGAWHAFMLRLGARSTLWAAAAFLVVTAWAAFVAYVDLHYWLFHYTVSKSNTDSLADRVAYFTAVWSIQAALIGLVYPIVIGFVTLLLARQRSSSAALPIYLHDSAAQLAGASSLLLVVAMGIQYVQIPYVDSTTAFNWTVLDATWFLVNGALTFHFLVRTYQFIKPTTRFEITRRYMVGVAWPNEVRRHLAALIFRAATHENLVPGPAYGDKHDGVRASVLMGYSIEPSKQTLTVSLRKRQFQNVRFRTLAWAIKLWQARANALHKQKMKPQTRHGGRQGSAPYIVFPLQPLSTYDGLVTLCGVVGDPAPSMLEKVLISWSFAFGAPPKMSVVDVRLSDILSDTQADAMEALRNDDLEMFKEQITRLAHLYETLIAASEVRDSSGGQTNLLLISDRESVFGESVYRSLTLRLLDLFKGAASKLPSENGYVEVLMYLPNRLYGKALAWPVSELLTHLVELSPRLYRLVERWWEGAIEQDGQTQHGPCNGVVLSPPSRGAHNRAVKGFVEAWESLRTRMSPRNVEKDSWSEHELTGGRLERHLFHTAVLLCETVLRGDRNGTKWLTDVLITWYTAQQSWFSDPRAHTLFRPYFVTLDILRYGSTDIAEQVRSASISVAGELVPMAVLSSALQNLWADMCCIVIYVQIGWGKACGCDKSLSAFVVRALALGTPLRDDGHSISAKPYRDAETLFLAILRQRYADARYTARLNGYVEQLTELTRPEVIAGRIYSQYGARDLEYLAEEQLMALLLAAPNGWQPGNNIRMLLQSWSNVRDDDRRALERLLIAWKGKLEEPDFSHWQNAYDCLKQDNAMPFQEARTSLATSFGQLADFVTSIHKQAVAAAAPSAQRLLQIGQWASMTAFQKGSAAFPISEFEVRDIVGDLDSPMTLTINRVNKGEFTEPPLSQTAINEGDWLADVVREHAAAMVLWKVISDLNPVERAAKTAQSYWREFKKYVNEVREAGLHPLILLENPTIPDWLYEWANPFPNERPAEKPADLVITRDNGSTPDGYQFTVNGVPVISAPLPSGSSILLVLESLHEVTFGRTPDGSFVTATVEPIPSEDDVVDLKLTWQARVKTGAYPAVRLIYSRDDEPK